MCQFKSDLLLCNYEKKGLANSKRDGIRTCPSRLFGLQLAAGFGLS
jgi:hypothetical protein